MDNREQLLPTRENIERLIDFLEGDSASKLTAQLFLCVPCEVWGYIKSYKHWGGFIRSHRGLAVKEFGALRTGDVWWPKRHHAYNIDKIHKIKAAFLRRVLEVDERFNK